LCLGFDYDFHALEGEQNELHEAFSVAFRVEEDITFMRILRAFVPVLGLFVSVFFIDFGDYEFSSIYL
jgi:hypothetical protein